MLTQLRLRTTQWMSSLTRRLQNSFYLILAALLTIGILLDAGVFHIGENMRQKAFDFMVRHRVMTPPADPDIVIIDVNEASLAALAPEYGRWPWPRQVFGEFVEKLQAQQPKAIVFDILFADADIYNPDSDAYFNDVIKATDNVFFPFLRLPQEHDALSQVSPGAIPGVRFSGDVAPTNTTVAVVLPHFDGALKPDRLGTHNIYPDADGIVREYRLWQDKDGWRLPSLPLQVGTYAAMNSLPPPQNMLINWRGGPFTYANVSFSDVYLDMTAKTQKRPSNEFTGKIVIIGSTAPSLFDLKATAMAKIHPGVEILATAIDNIKHGDYLHFPRGSTLYVLMSLLLIWSTATAFFRNVDRDRFAKMFGFSQTGLLAVSYLGINLTNTYLDLTGPVTWAVAYFSIAKMYALANDRAMQRWLEVGIKPGQAGLQVKMMPVLIESPIPPGDALMAKVKRQCEALAPHADKVELLKGTQSGIWGLFGDMIVVTWTEPAGNSPSQHAGAEAEAIAGALPGTIRQLGLPAGTITRYSLHDGQLNGSQPLGPQWRILFAQAVIRLEHPDQHAKETVA